MTRVLEMKFETAHGKEYTLSLYDPKTNLTAAEVSNAMQSIINQNVFQVNGFAISSIKQARIVDKTIENLI